MRKEGRRELERTYWPASHQIALGGLTSSIARRASLSPLADVRRAWSDHPGWFHGPQARALLRSPAGLLGKFHRYETGVDQWRRTLAQWLCAAHEHVVSTVRTSYCAAAPEVRGVTAARCRFAVAASTPIFSPSEASAPFREPA